MPVVHVSMSTVSPNTCKDVADAFTKTIESRCKNYEVYARENSIKDIIRRLKLGVLQSSTRAYIVDDISPSMTQSYFWLTMKLGIRSHSTWQTKSCR